MVEYVQYVTQDGDRWDLIASRMYGDPWAFEAIIVANPHVPIRPVLPGGLTLHVPVREPATATDDTLPPWKRGGT